MKNWKRSEKSVEDTKDRYDDSEKGKSPARWIWTPLDESIENFSDCSYGKTQCPWSPWRWNSSLKDKRDQGNWKLQRIYLLNDSGNWQNSKRMQLNWKGPEIQTSQFLSLILIRSLKVWELEEKTCRRLSWRNSMEIPFLPIHSGTHLEVPLITTLVYQMVTNSIN